MDPGLRERPAHLVLEGVLAEVFFPRAYGKATPEEDALQAFQKMLKDRNLVVRYDNMGNLFFDCSDENQSENHKDLYIPNVVVNPEWVFPRANSYILYESRVGQSRDSFNIYNSRNETVLTAKGKFWSWGKAIHIYDMQQKPLVLVDQRHFHLHTTYDIAHPGDSSVYARVKKQIVALKSTYEVFTKAHGSKTLLYKIEGNFHHYNYNGLFVCLFGC